MQDKELRIGNWVDYNDRVYQIDSGKFLDLSLNNCMPIPLTEEWLERFGFLGNDYNDEYTFIPYGKNIFTLDREYTDKGEWDFCMNQTYLTTIQYVHQLENLYFSLTGEELELIG